MIAVAVVMTILGTRLTGLSPRIAAWSPTLPVGLGPDARASRGAGGRVLGRAGRGPRRRLLLPALRLHPGGPGLRALDRLARSSPAPSWRSSRSGPRPASSPSPASPLVVPAAWRPTLLRFVGVVVIGFAVVNASAGLRLAGFSLPIPGVEARVGCRAAQPARRPCARDGTQALVTFQDAAGYSPGNVSIYAGPHAWTIESSTTAHLRRFARRPRARHPASRSTKGANTIELPALPPGRSPTRARWGCTAAGSRSWSAPPERPAGARPAADHDPGTNSGPAPPMPASPRPPYPSSTAVP